MSRRTKLCITALFLILLAIPVGYGFLTWAPADALRFRITRDRAETLRASETIAMRVYDVEIKNTSATAIHITVGDLIQRSVAASSVQLAPMDYPGYINSDGNGGTSGPLPAICTVPPYGIHLARAYVLTDQVPSFLQQDHLIRCSWMSETKRRALRLRNWLEPRLPESLRPHLNPLFLEQTDFPIDTTAVPPIQEPQPNQTSSITNHR